MTTKGILGTKGASEQRFTNDGDRIPVTRVETQPCFILDVRTKDKDGYWAIVLGTGSKKTMNKSDQGLLKKAGVKASLRFLSEIRFEDAEEIVEGEKRGIKVADFEMLVGSELKPSEIFVEGDLVDATGTSKGKGFQGVVKRHGFAGGPRTHGQSDRERAPGSIGMSATPGRVLKGKRMAGRMGNDTVTVQNLEVIEAGEDYILLKGLLPGAKSGLVQLVSENPVQASNEASEQVSKVAEEESGKDANQQEDTKAEKKEEPKEEEVTEKTK